MQIPHHVRKILELTHTFGWLAGVDDQLKCEYCRTCGTWITDEGYLTVIITPSMAKSLVDTIKSNSNVACTIVNALTMESYQLKGMYIEHRALSSDEEKLKESYMQGMLGVLNDMGLEYGGRFKKYADMDGVAVKMKINEVFEQTPRQGSSGNLIVKEIES